MRNSSWATEACRFVYRLTRDPTWPTQDLWFQRNKNILATTCYNQLASVASKKPFGETSASGYHGRIPRSPSRRSTKCLAKGSICMFCCASQTTRRWKGICSCFMPHNYLTKSSHSIRATQCHHQSRSQSGMARHGAKEMVLFRVELWSKQLMFEKLSGCRHHGYNARQILVNFSSLPFEHSMPEPFSYFFDIFCLS